MSITKFILAFAAVAAILAPSAAFARSINVTGGSLDCDSGILTDSLGATSTMSTALCSGGGGMIVGTIPMPWGLLDGQTPITAPGTTVYDERGVPGMCPWFYPLPGCYDLTHTFWYRLAHGYIDALGNVLK